MLKVGLTGGIGSGKTLIGSIFNHIGIPVFNADLESKNILNTDIEIIKYLKNKFGDDIYSSEGINRKKLASIIFNNEKLLTEVNSIIHPKVREYFANWINNFKSASYVINEAAILFESGVYKDMDITINIYADELLRINRVVKRDKTNVEAVKSRIKNQLSDKERIDLADFTIYNDGNKMILPQVLEIHNEILKNIK